MGSLPAGYVINPNDVGNVPPGVPALSPRPSNKGKCMTHCIFLRFSLALRNVNSVHTCPGWTEAGPPRGVSSLLPLDVSAKVVRGGVD